MNLFNSSENSKYLLPLEGIRAAFGYVNALYLKIPLQTVSPKGDGHPVVVFPGLATSDDSTLYLRSYLDGLGYKSYTWGHGFNMGPKNGFDNFVKALHETLKTIYKENNNQKITLIGWSLGGLYSRELAKIDPSMIRSVITLGTPFQKNATPASLEMMYELLSQDKSHNDPKIWDQLSQKPPVPFTSIYSKSDGVVKWEASIEEESSISENIEIPCSGHLELGSNPFAMYIIANRLAQPSTTWVPFKKI